MNGLLSAQNNTAEQEEKTYTQREVNLMVQVQELERQVTGMQKNVQYSQKEIELQKDTLDSGAVMDNHIK